MISRFYYKYMNMCIMAIEISLKALYHFLHLMFKLGLLELYKEEPVRKK